MKYEHTLCAAHQINLIVKNSIVEKEGEILKLFGRCRRIVGHIRHSNKAFTELKEIQEFHELPSHQLIQVELIRFKFNKLGSVHTLEFKPNNG